MTNVPAWFAFGSAAFMAVIVALSISRFARLRRQMKDNPEKMDDEWDPFA